MTYLQRIICPGGTFSNTVPEPNCLVKRQQRRKRKNDILQIADLVSYFDWELNEECFQYNECKYLTPFIDAGKPVFGIEYTGAPNDFCPEANQANFDWLKKNLELDAWRVSCR